MSTNAIVSGFCASAASLFGKLFGLPSLEDHLILRLFCIVLMVIFNGAVWTFYVKALQASNNSLTATVTSAATNYLFSAVYGFFIFGEITTLLWWSGAGCILLGLILIITDKDNKKTK